MILPSSVSLFHLALFDLLELNDFRLKLKLIFIYLHLV